MTVYRHFRRNGNENKQSRFDIMDKKKCSREMRKMRKTEQTFLAEFQRRRIGENNSGNNPGNNTASGYQAAVVSMVENEKKENPQVYTDLI